jgi:hypothetical protein
MWSAFGRRKPLRRDPHPVAPRKLEFQAVEAQQRLEFMIDLGHAAFYREATARARTGAAPAEGTPAL